MSLRDVPRLVWVLAVGRFLGSTSSYLMLFLTLYGLAAAATVLWSGRLAAPPTPRRTS